MIGTHHKFFFSRVCLSVCVFCISSFILFLCFENVSLSYLKYYFLWILPQWPFWTPLLASFANLRTENRKHFDYLNLGGASGPGLKCGGGFFTWGCQNSLNPLGEYPLLGGRWKSFGSAFQLWMTYFHTGPTVLRGKVRGKEKES